MSCVRVKVMVATLIFVCLTGCIFVSGCSMSNNKAEMPSGKALVIDLTDAPEYQPLLKGVPANVRDALGQGIFETGR